MPLLLVLHSTSTSVGTFTLYRNSLQSLFLTAETLFRTLRMAFQGVFLMGAFCAASALKPRLQPEMHEATTYDPSSAGMAIDVRWVPASLGLLAMANFSKRNLSFRYPENKVPALSNINLSVRAGETLAIVGYNGSGISAFLSVVFALR